MKMFVSTFAIDGLSDHFALVHGFTQRYFEDENGARTDLEFSRMWESETSKRHKRALLHSLRIDGEDLFLARQVHGNGVHLLHDPQTTPEEVARVDADAILTALTDRPIAVLTADCVPIVIYDPVQRAAAVVHAGRRGTAERIFSATVAAFQEHMGSRPEDLKAGLGPGIGGCCYEVDADCLEPFCARYPEWQRFVQPHENGKVWLDLFAANVQDGLAAGMLPEKIFRLGHCTACDTERFFSYRKEAAAGRLLTLAMLRPL